MTDLGTLQALLNGFKTQVPQQIMNRGMDGELQARVVQALILLIEAEVARVAAGGSSQ